MPRKPPPRPPVKPCAICGGKRPAGLRRAINCGGVVKTIAVCPECSSLCPNATRDLPQIDLTICQRRVGHHGLCGNKQHQTWNRRDYDAAIQKFTPLAV